MHRYIIPIFVLIGLLASCKTEHHERFDLLHAQKLTEPKPLTNITGLTIVNDSIAIVIADNSLNIYNPISGKPIDKFKINDKFNDVKNWLLLGLDTGKENRTMTDRKRVSMPKAESMFANTILRLSDSVIAFSYQYALPGAIHENKDTVKSTDSSVYFIAKYNLYTRQLLENKPVDLYFEDEFQSIPEFAFCYDGKSFFMGGYQYLPRTSGTPSPFAIKYNEGDNKFVPGTPLYVNSMKMIVTVESMTAYPYCISNTSNMLTVAYRDSIADLQTGKILFSLKGLPGKNKAITYHALVNKGVYARYYNTENGVDFKYYDVFTDGTKPQYREIPKGTISNIYQNTLYQISKEDEGVYIKEYFIGQ